MFLLAIALSVTMPQDRWVQVGRTKEFEEYVDKESVRRTGSKVALWTQRNFLLGRSFAWSELELDCAARTATILSFVRDDGGAISHNVDRPHRAASPIAAGSTEETIFGMVCR